MTLLCTNSSRPAEFRLRRIVLLLAVLARLLVNQLHSDEQSLSRDFNHPPPAARPWAWWFWANGHISAAGIHDDLASMQEVGLGGINLFNAAPAVPPGPVRFFSPQWKQLVRQAGQEAKQRNLSMIMLDCAGWSGSGGPWIPVQESMQMLVWSETNVEGSATAQPISLAVPQHLAHYYGDIAVLAFPSPRATAFPVPRVTSNVSGFNAAPLVDGNVSTKVDLPSPGDGQWVRLDYDRPVTAAGFTVVSGALSRAGKAWIMLDAQQPDGAWREVSRMDAGVWHTQLYLTTSATCTPTTAASWRVRWQAEEIPALSVMAPISVAELRLESATRVHDWEFRTGNARRWGHDGGWRDTPPEAYVGVPTSSVIPLNSILDLTARLKPNGQLDWSPPPGRWTVLRIGHTTNGARVSPAPAGGEGWEPDTMDPRGHGINETFANYLDPLLSPSGAALSGVLTGVEMDSWEMNTQTWTARLPEVFRLRRGYDLLPWLVVSAGGRIVDSPRESERYLWDLRRTLADMIAENYYGHMASELHQRGLAFYSEASGAQQFLYDPINYFRSVDIPIGEFWANSTGPRADCKLAASAAQLYDRKIVGAESYTAPGGWKESPRSLKPLADAAFVAGVNRIIIASFVHQPWVNGTPNVAPGATLGPWGIDFNRFATWWRDGHAFTDYLARCSALLQGGQFVGDVLYLLDEGIPNGLGYQPGPFRNTVPGILPAGFDFTATDVRALRERVTVQNGKLLLANGASYRLLVLPKSRQFTPEGLQVVADLVRAGATAVGPKPVASPSRNGGAGADERVRVLADALWGEGENGASGSGHRYGEGRVFSRGPLGALLAQIRVEPDVAWTDLGPQDLDYVHRQVGNADVYFVINRTAAAVTVRASFRIAGRLPELWNAESGASSTAPIFQAEAGRTAVPLSLPPYGSIFVVFRQPAAPAHYTDVRGPQGALANLEVTRPGEYQLQSNGAPVRRVSVPMLPADRIITGPWQIEFQAPSRPPFQVDETGVGDWSASSDARVKYFAGTGVYTTHFNLTDRPSSGDRRTWLDLGQVEVVAEVELNGHSLGVLWHYPYRVDVTDFLRAGSNELRLSVTNLWVNRLIGDEQEPADTNYSPGGALKALPQWLTAGSPRPTRRQTFAFWRHYKADDALLPSGLLGPVQLVTTVRLPLPTKDSPTLSP